MKHVATIALALLAGGVAQAQGNGWQMNRAYAGGGSPAANARMPQLMAYPDSPAGAPVSVYGPPPQGILASQPTMSELPAEAKASDIEPATPSLLAAPAALPAPTSELDDLPPTAPSTDAMPPSDMPPADMPPSDMPDSEEKAPLDEKSDVVRPRLSTPAQPAPAAAPEPARQPTPQALAVPFVPAAPMPAQMAPAPAPQPTVTGHLFHLEQMQQLVNYSVPVHYPKKEVRGTRWYGEAYFAFLWAKDQSPPVILRAPNNDVAVGGDLQFDNGERLGWRFTLGHWLDGTQTSGAEVTYMGFAERDPEFFGTNLFRPQPGLFVVEARVNAPSRFYTVEVNYRREYCRGCWGNIDWLCGLRYAELDEALNISTVEVTTNESYRTENRVVAAQVGLDAELVYRYFSLSAFGKAGVGNAHQWVGVNSDTLEPAGPAGIRRNHGTALLETGIFANLQVTATMRASVGYTFLYFSNMARPSDQIDDDPTRFAFGDSSYWVQGLNLGLEFRF